MRRWFFLLAACLVLPINAQTESPGVALANLREDIRGLNEKLTDLSLRVDQLEAENARLREKLALPKDLVTTGQLQAAISELKQSMTAAIAAAQEKPAPPASEPASAPETARSTSFSTNFPKEGISYVVAKGDTVALIAKKTGAKFQDIVNANRLADPSRIYIGQKLFIPGGK
jgi:nucleoid-associated protein YgaU